MTCQECVRKFIFILEEKIAVCKRIFIIYVNPIQFKFATYYTVGEMLQHNDDIHVLLYLQNILIKFFQYYG